MTDGLSAADVMALTNNGTNEGLNGIWNNPFIYFVWMALFGGGMFGNRFNDANQGALTRAELTDGLGRQDILRNQDNIQTELSSFERDTATNLGNIRYDNLQNTFNLSSQLAENRFAQQSCCCETNRNIDSLKAEGFKNTCEITTAIHSEGELTRALITENTIQALRDKLADKDRELLSANMQISQFSQNQFLIDQLRPVAKPAYITCSPYTSNGCSGTCGI